MNEKFPEVKENQDSGKEGRSPEEDKKVEQGTEQKNDNEEIFLKIFDIIARKVAENKPINKGDVKEILSDPNNTGKGVDSKMVISFIREWEPKLIKTRDSLKDEKSGGDGDFNSFVERTGLYLKFRKTIYDISDKINRGQVSISNESIEKIIIENEGEISKHTIAFLIKKLEAIKKVLVFTPGLFNEEALSGLVDLILKEDYYDDDVSDILNVLKESSTQERVNTVIEKIHIKNLPLDKRKTELLTEVGKLLRELRSEDIKRLSEKYLIEVSFVEDFILYLNEKKIIGEPEAEVNLFMKKLKSEQKEEESKKIEEYKFRENYLIEVISKYPFNLKTRKWAPYSDYEVMDAWLYYACGKKRNSVQNEAGIRRSPAFIKFIKDMKNLSIIRNEFSEKGYAQNPEKIAKLTITRSDEN